MNKLELLCDALFLVILFGAFICSWVSHENDLYIKHKIAVGLCDYQNYSYGYYQTKVTYNDADGCKNIFQDEIVCSNGNLASNKIIYIGEAYKYGYCYNY